MYKQISRKGSSESIADSISSFLYYKKASGLSERTVNDYEVYINLFIDYTKPSGIGDFSYSAYMDYVNMLQQKGLSPNTINTHISYIRVFLYDLMDKGKIERFKIKTLKKQEDTFKIYSDSELEKLVAKPTKKANFAECRMHAAICLMLATGARASTVINIYKDDIDFYNEQIAFRHMKTKQALVVPLSDSLHTILRDFINEWDIESDFLFPEVTGEQMSYNALRLSLNRYCNKRNVEHKGLHAFRHNFARGWVLNNGNMFQLQRVLGHSTLNMTQKYVRLFSDDLKDNYEDYSLLDTLEHKKTWSVKKSV